MSDLTTVSLKTPWVKFLLSTGRSALSSALGSLAAKAANDHRKADAINAARTAIDAALASLEAI